MENEFESSQSSWTNSQLDDIQRALASEDSDARLQALVSETMGRGQFRGLLFDIHNKGPVVFKFNDNEELIQHVEFFWGDSMIQEFHVSDAKAGAYRIILSELPRHTNVCNMDLAYFFHRTGFTLPFQRISQAIVVGLEHPMRPMFRDIPDDLVKLPVIHNTDTTHEPYHLLVSCMNCSTNNVKCSRHYFCDRCSHRLECKSNIEAELRMRANKVTNAIRNYKLPRTNFITWLIDVRTHYETGKPMIQSVKDQSFVYDYVANIPWADHVPENPPLLSQLPEDMKEFVAQHPYHKVERICKEAYQLSLSPLYDGNIVRMNDIKAIMATRNEKVIGMLIDGHRLNDPFTAYCLLVEAFDKSPMVVSTKTKMLYGGYPYGGNPQEIVVNVEVSKMVVVYRKGLLVATGISFTS